MSEQLLVRLTKWNRYRECSHLYNETQGTMDLVGCKKINNNNICNNNNIIIYFLTPDQDFLSKVFVCNFVVFVVVVFCILSYT